MAPSISCSRGGSTIVDGLLKMGPLNRRSLLAAASAIGAQAVWARAEAQVGAPRTRNDLFPQGVASGDPTSNSIVLWTRRPPDISSSQRLTVQVSRTRNFDRIVASGIIELGAAADYTARAIVGGLAADKIYWYRFVDDLGFSSRIGRTQTAPPAQAGRSIRFAFASCQNAPLGYCTPYRRMIVEDEARDESDRIRFVLHLGDFVYDEVWYPEDAPAGFLGRTIRPILTFPDGALVRGVRVPVTLADYRTLYKTYLSDPDLQAARAQWPFVCVWDNHEFSSPGWQSASAYAEAGFGAQSRKAYANQAWFEYIPSLATHTPAGAPLSQFRAPQLEDAPLDRFDSEGLSHEPNNLAAINSLIIYRRLRFGRHLDLILTDNRSFRSPPAASALPAGASSPSAPFFLPADAIAALDAGRPEKISLASEEVDNPRAAAAPRTMLGATQRSWFLDTLRSSDATWKVWGNAVAALERRSDLHNLPAMLRRHWPGAGYGVTGGDDWGGYPSERKRILDFIAAEGVTNIVSLAGDRHQFFAGLLSPALPPDTFQPVAAEFVVGAISTPCVFEAANFITRSGDLRPLYVHDGERGPEPAINLTLRHGVSSALALHETNDLERALSASNPEVAPHLAFTDSSSHGYAIACVDEADFSVEFVALPAPIAPSTETEGDPLRFRIVHRLRSWRAHQRPVLLRVSTEGEIPLGAL